MDNTGSGYTKGIHLVQDHRLSRVSSYEISEKMALLNEQETSRVQIDNAHMCCLFGSNYNKTSVLVKGTRLLGL